MVQRVLRYKPHPVGEVCLCSRAPFNAEMMAYPLLVLLAI